MLYNVFNLSFDHVTKVYATGRLDTISSSPQKFGPLKVSCFETLIMAMSKSYYKMRQKKLLKSYYKVQQKFIAKCIRKYDWYYKMWQKFVTKCVRFYKVCQVLQSVTGYYYKVRQILQSVTVITKWDVTHMNDYIRSL